MKVLAREILGGSDVDRIEAVIVLVHLSESTGEPLGPLGFSSSQTSLF